MKSVNPRFRPWAPLLSGDVAQRAAALVVQIAVYQQRLSKEGLSEIELSEQALLFAYTALQTGKLEWWDAMQESLALSVAGQISSSSVALYGGMCDVAWIVQHLLHLTSSQGGTEDSDPLNDVDRYIYSRLFAGDWEVEYDLISGLIGVGVYLVSRPPTAYNRLMHSQLIDHLDRASIVDRGTRAWLTPNQYVAPSQRIDCPSGQFNLGMAHGIPGIIRFLSSSASEGYEANRCMSMIQEAIRWLELHKPSVASVPQFPYWISEKMRASGSRVAWCYGDFSIGVSLYLTGTELDVQDWKSDGEKLICGCLSRVPDGVADPGLCHGSSGLAHIYHRLYLQTRLPRYRDAAGAYYLQTILFLERASQHSTDHLVRFIDGDIGSALALISAISSIEPMWNSRLLLH